MGERQTVLGQLAGMKVSKGSLHKVPAVHRKAKKLGPRVLGVKEAMFFDVYACRKRNSAWNGILTRVTYQLSYQADRELVTLWVRNIPVHADECSWIKDYNIYLSCGQRDQWLITAVIHTTLSVVKLQPGKQNSGLNGIWADNSVGREPHGWRTANLNWPIKIQ